MMQRSTFSAMRGFASFAVKNMKLEKAAPLAAVGASQVSLSMIASPVHKADRAVASSGAIGGSEGVGKVTAVGAGVTNLKVGDWVVPKLGAGAWRSEAVVEAAHVMMVPNDVPAAYAASMNTDAATAYRLLRDFGVKKGDWLIQSDAGSAVGVAVIQMARDMGVKTINVIDSQSADQETLLRLLTNLGGDINCTDLYVHSHGMNHMLQGQNVALAINNLGGDVATNMGRVLSDTGVMVSYEASADQKAFVFPAERKPKLAAFSIADWHGKCSALERAAMVSDIAAAVREERLTQFFQEHDFDDFEYALHQAGETNIPARKVVLRMDHPDRLAEHDALDPTTAYTAFETTVR